MSRFVSIVFAHEILKFVFNDTKRLMNSRPNKLTSHRSNTINEVGSIMSVPNDK